MRKARLRPLRSARVSGEQAAAQSHYREGADDEADGPIRTAQVVADVQRNARQNRTEAEKAEKGGRDDEPSAHLRAREDPIFE